MAWYPVSVAMAWDMCTCAVKTNLLMENRPYLCELPRLGIFVISPITISGVIYAAVVSMWSGCGVYEERKHTQFFFFFFFFFSIYCFYSPTLSHMASPSGPTSARQGLLSIWQKGWRTAFEHPINCHAGCSAMPTTFIPPAAWHITSVPAHHTAICWSKSKTVQSN